MTFCLYQNIRKEYEGIYIRIYDIKLRGNLFILYQWIIPFQSLSIFQNFEDMTCPVTNNYNIVLNSKLIIRLIWNVMHDLRKVPFALLIKWHTFHSCDPCSFLEIWFIQCILNQLLMIKGNSEFDLYNYRYISEHERWKHEERVN